MNDESLFHFDHEVPHEFLPDPEALQEVMEIHMSLDAPSEPIVFSNAANDLMFSEGYDDSDW